MNVNYYRLITKALFRFDPEHIHTLTLNAVNGVNLVPGGGNLLQRTFVFAHPALQTTVSGITFPNPIGLAAGYDKDGIAVNALQRLGFGYLEVGTVTPMAQTGNAKPRLFRLTQQEALINRIGFANRGANTMSLTARAWQRKLPIGINIGKQRYTAIEQAADDYVACFKTLALHANYVALNISSPNTPRLRRLQTAKYLEQLLERITPLRQLSPQRYVPLWIKVSPDETEASLTALGELCLRYKIDGIIAVNTSSARPLDVIAASALWREPGGLSGKPIALQAETTLHTLYAVTKGKIPLISVGGIDNALTAYQRLKAGASLLQLYTGMVYQGAYLPSRLAAGIVQALQADGLTSIKQLKHAP